MYCIILCGGSGTRLWPLSRINFPKQFLKLYSDRSLIQETFDRMSGAIDREKIYFVTSGDSFFNVFNQIKEIYPEFKKEQIIVEPTPRDTAPAFALAVKHLCDKVGVAGDAPIIVVPSDHYIGKKEVYLETVRKALNSAGGNIGTIGIVPTKPETGFGYIEKGEKEQEHYRVAAFKEKPDEKTAAEFLSTGKYVWNAGMYIFKAETFGRELKKCDPALHAAYAKPYDDFLQDFATLPKISIDYALAERSERVIVFEGDFDWSDIGSFDAMAEIVAKNESINTNCVAYDSKNVYTNSVNNRLIVTVGIDDINVVENHDVILVQKKGQSAEIKKVVEQLKESGRKEVEHNVMGYRPWGEYEVLVDADNHKVKKITVYPGAKLSLQSHKRRVEHWVVVKGTAKVVNGENLLTLHENESTYISTEAKHQLSNPGETNLEIIEVQTGDYFGEDDIFRYEDQYGRSSGMEDVK